MSPRKPLSLLAAVVATGWWLSALGQQPRMPVIGFLGISNPERAAGWLADLHEGLGQAGFIEGRNFTVDYRWAEGNRNRIPALVADLVGRRVDVFVTPDPGAAVAAKNKSMTTPIVFVTEGDPIGLGLVERLNRPGGNATGIAGDGLTEKRLQLLHELVPAATRIGYLVDHKISFWPGELERVVGAGKTLGVEVILLTADQPDDIEPAVAHAKRKGIGAILVQFPSTLFFTERSRVVELLAHEALPATCPPNGWPAPGCLMYYVPTDMVQLAGT